MRRFIILFIGLIGNLAVHAQTSSWQWQSFTAMRHVKELCGGMDLLYCETAGGLLAFDKMSTEFSIWNNSDGLASNDITAIIYDEKGTLWIGTEQGWVQNFNPIQSNWYLVEDFEGHPVHCFSLYGDSLFVGLDIGISLYLISRKEVKETYRHLGSQLQIDLPVEEIVIHEGEIWATTEEGLAYSDLSNDNLMDPESWQNITEIDGLPDKQIQCITKHKQELFFGTPKGIVQMQNGILLVIGQQFTNDLVSHEDSLYAATEEGIYQWQGGSNWRLIGEAYIKSLTSAFSILWGGSKYGLHRYNPNNNYWASYKPDCIGGNLISDLAVGPTNELWISSRDGGFFLYDGFHWTVYDHTNLLDLRDDDFYTIAVDDQNNKWAGSWGEGIVFIGYDQNVQFYNAQNGYLSGISNDPDYAVVSDIEVDPYGTVWICNLEAANNLPLISVSNSNQWTYYGLQDGIESNFPSAITVDSEGRKWIGTSIPNAQGIYILDDRGTPDYKYDDPPVLHLTTADGLETNEITDLAVDKEGGMWIGTPQGLHYYYNGMLSRRYGLPSNNVTALAVDGVNNIWVGTNAGLSTFSNESYSWIQYTEDNSYLLSNDITSLVMNPNSGMLYIGTNKGVSGLQTPYSNPKSDLSELRFFPNPFCPEEHGFMIIDNLAEKSAIYIYTSTGHIVRRFTQSDAYGKRVSWDGTNDLGQNISGGIYLIVVHTEDGETRTGKIVIVR